MQLALALCLLSTSLLLQFASALNNGLAKLPPMGWMSWSRFFCETNCAAHPTACINEQLYQVHADRLVSDGFKDVGYTHIHIDDCWSEKSRGKHGELIPDRKRFSSGIPALVDYMHKRGLKLGIYGDVGIYTCAGYPASHNNEEIDARTFADWNVDYLKFDGCNLDIPELRKGYPLFYEHLNATGKPIIYSCEWPLYEYEHKYPSNYTAISATCNLFRNYHDVANSYDSVLDIIRYYVTNQNDYIPFHGPGSWFDPDMLVIGNGLSEAESRSQMAVWSVWSAPLIMSNDLRVLEAPLRKILQNRDVIAVDQDPLGIMGKMVQTVNDVFVFVKPMTPFVAKERRFSFAIETILKFSQLNMTNADGYELKNLWTGEVVGVKKPTDEYAVRIGGHDAAMFKATLVNGQNDAKSHYV
ncbi:Alpha-galactosidase [Aphelenchoides fujianensis]|nr:Alpha-galactosidase [Aphelenchoides fujianensis]